MSTVNVDAKQIKALREKTNAGMMECRKALMENGADMAKAEEWLKTRGLAKAEQKKDRVTAQGKVGCYLHMDGKGGAMVELASETDFVAQNEKFRELLKDLCLQVYATNPQVLKREDIHAEQIAEGRKKFAEEVKGKPAEVAEKIVQGKLDKNFFSQRCLLEQAFVKDPSGKTLVKDMIAARVSEFGENLSVRRFARFEVGQP